MLCGEPDLFVMPSLAENLPNTLVESLACGTPCVCFDIGGCPEIIEHRQCGYLARPFEVEDLAHGITSLLTDDDLRQRMTEQAPKRASTLFDARQIADRYIDLYQQTRSSYGLA